MYASQAFRFPALLHKEEHFESPGETQNGNASSNKAGDYKLIFALIGFFWR
jgi:hypothetical protein